MTGERRSDLVKHNLKGAVHILLHPTTHVDIVDYWFQYCCTSMGMIWVRVRHCFHSNYGLWLELKCMESLRPSIDSRLWLPIQHSFWPPQMHLHDSQSFQTAVFFTITRLYSRQTGQYAAWKHGVVSANWGSRGCPTVERLTVIPRVFSAISDSPPTTHHPPLTVVYQGCVSHFTIDGTFLHDNETFLTSETYPANGISLSKRNICRIMIATPLTSVKTCLRETTLTLCLVVTWPRLPRGLSCEMACRSPTVPQNNLHQAFLPLTRSFHIWKSCS